MKLNDKFKTKDEAIATIKEELKKENFTHDEIVITTKTITFPCIGKKEFHCDAIVHLFFKKKEDCFIIKKLKLNHKCPPDLKDGVNYLSTEIEKCVNNQMRIGEIVLFLNRKGLKVGYSNVYKFIHKDVASNNIHADNHTQHMLEKSYNFNEGLYSTFVREFLMLNSHCSGMSDNSSIFLIFPCLQHVRNILEIKITKRKDDGFIMFCLCFDPHDTPIILAFCVSDEKNMEKAFSNFKSMLKPHIPANIVFLCELKDCFLLKNEIFFIKTRSICKEIYSRTKDRNLIVKVWDFCNSNTEYEEIPILNELINEYNIEIGENKKEIIDVNKENNPNFSKNYLISLKNYRRIDLTLFGLENLSDPDLDMLYFNFMGDTLEVTNIITKLISENNLSKRKKETSFGENIKSKINRKIDIQFNVEELADSHNVIIGSEVYNISLNDIFCTCGFFQEWGCPCTHALLLIKYLELNPTNFVSSMFIFKKEIYVDVLPVINESLKQPNQQMLLRRGPGRPKKGHLRRYEEVVH